MTKTIKHRSGLLFEVTNSPFFGPKQRAIIELNKFNGTPLSHNEFIDYLMEKYSGDFKEIQWIRFHDFIDTSFDDKKFSHTMRVAIFNTSPSIKARQIFFEEREEITQNTGWYPLVMGERANFRIANIKRLNNNNSIESIGCLLGFNPISNSDLDGVSFELCGTKGKYLFDFGYKGVNKSDYKGFFLTHTHSDHSEGFARTIENNDNALPTICSKLSASFLNFKKDLIPNTKNYNNIYHIDFKEDIILQDNLKIKFIPIYHSPGSIGFVITDSNGISFFYLGDICLKNGFSDSRSDLREFIIRNKTKKNYVLLDGAMIGRKHFIEEEDTPESILSAFSKNVNRRNIIFFSNQPENSIYAYLKVFNITQQDDNLKSVKLLVSPSLMQSLKFIIEPIVLHQDEFRDSVYLKIFGKSKSNPVESQRLYPLNNRTLTELESNERAIIFAGIKDLKKYSGLTNRFEKADIILAGTFALRENLPEELIKAKPRTIIRVASENWGFHSSQEDLREFIDSIISDDLKIYLFHNYFQRLIKFIQTSNFNIKYIRALGDKYHYERF